jgi:DMSO/TMAO reductase YedYZ molybdopterin-dependent catalytic subunit
MARNVAALFRYLDGLHGRAPLPELMAQLKELDVSWNDFEEFLRFSDLGYQRNLVRAGPWYNVWVLCWKNGQRSPIHDHFASSCGVRVLRGTLTETLFAFAANGHVKATESRDLPAGSVIGNQDESVHQASNLQDGGAELITLHVYSPPLTRMRTYSLTDRTRGEEIWLEERKVVTAFPENSETPLESVQGWVTPNRLFFVRNHFDVPTIDRAKWRLRVEGCVERPVEWTWDELQQMPARSVFATVECAGNGRSFLQNRVPGVPWGAGAVGHAEWTGVPLRALLERAGVRHGAIEVLCEGMDCGTEEDHPEPMHFARSLPLAKALDPDTLLAYRMNGELLEMSHGFPVRLFVPGWYGVASVKWLRRIEVLGQPFKGYFQTTKYTVQRRTASGSERTVVGPMAVKSEIIRPQPGAVLGVGTNRLFGVAWAGEEAVAAVELSTDGGAVWNSAELIGPRVPYSWTMWEYLWEVAVPGPYTVLARAISASGQVQPLEHDSLCGGYQIHHSRPIPVQVQAAYHTIAQRGAADLWVYDMNAFAEENARFPLDVELEFAAGEGI